MPYVKVDERRAQIVAAARAALARDGISGTTTRSLAAEAGIPLSSLHYAFQSKDEILRAVLADVIEEISGGLHSLGHRGGGLADALRQGLRASFDRGIRSPQTQLLQYELTTYALRTDGLADLARWQYEQYREILANWCREAATAAGERCAVEYDVLARVLLAGLDGLVIQHLADPDDERARADLDQIIEAVIGLAAPSTGS